MCDNIAHGPTMGILVFSETVSIFVCSYIIFVILKSLIVTMKQPRFLKRLISTASERNSTGHRNCKNSEWN